MFTHPAIQFTHFLTVKPYTASHALHSQMCLCTELVSARKRPCSHLIRESRITSLTRKRFSMFCSVFQLVLVQFCRLVFFFIFYTRQPLFVISNVCFRETEAVNLATDSRLTHLLIVTDYTGLTQTKSSCCCLINLNLQQQPQMIKPPSHQCTLILSNYTLGSGIFLSNISLLV